MAKSKYLLQNPCYKVMFIYYKNTYCLEVYSEILNIIARDSYYKEKELKRLITIQNYAKLQCSSNTGT